MLQDFSVDIQDGSVEHTASCLETVYRDIYNQRFDGWKVLMSRKERRDQKKKNGEDIVEKLQVLQTQGDSDDDEEEGDSDVDMAESNQRSRASATRNEPDEDGWFTVSRKS
jgi:hypothetical protein